MNTIRRTPVLSLLVLSLLVLPWLAGPAAAQAGDPAATPQPLVDTYSSLADVLLGAQKTEWNLVHSILATTYGHAEAAANRAIGALKAGEKAGPDIELLAELVAQLGNEGDASVAAIRKRLLEGGHHHHHHHAAAGEGGDDDYDEGFVIVNRKAKKQLLDAAGRIGRMAGGSPKADDLAREWETVRAVFGTLHEGAGAGH